MTNAQKRMTSPASLVAIALAAYRSNDKALLQSTKRLLKAEFGIEIRFTQKQPETAK